MNYTVPTPEAVDVRWHFDRNDRNAPRALSVNDMFRNVPEPRSYRATDVTVTVFPGSEELPVTRFEGVPLNTNGDADRRATYARFVYVHPQIEAMFVAAALEQVR